eukprot:COSAG01_NODE_29357_length_639_cov_10.346296_1_plen_209_part_10
MDMEDGKHIANTDWVEDIRNFTGQATADVWFDEVKIKFNDVVGRLEGGWAQLFDKYDDDGSGEIDYDEFLGALRKDCDMPPEDVSDADLRKVFKLVDVDSSGAITHDEFDRLLISASPASKPVTTMSFEIFFGSMFELAETWSSRFEPKPVTTFLNMLFEKVTVNANTGVPGAPVDTQLRAVLTQKLRTTSGTQVMYQLDADQELKLVE